jgi:hypothetical protein
MLVHIAIHGDPIYEHAVPAVLHLAAMVDMAVPCA